MKKSSKKGIKDADMKRIHLLKLTMCCLLLGAYSLGYAQVGINGTGGSPDPSAGLDINFSDKGLLPPRLTEAQRDAIANPAIGLQIYNTDTDCIDYYSSGNSWLSLCGTNACTGFSLTLVGNDVTCQGGSDGSATATPVNGTSPYGFAWTGSGSTTGTAGTLAAGNYSVTITDANSCTASSSIVIADGITSSAAPIEGVHVPDAYQIQWVWTSVSGADGYKYNTTNNYGTATDVSTATSYTQTGLTCGNVNYTLYVWAYNACGVSAVVTLNSSTSGSCPFACGSSTVTDVNSNVYNTVQIGAQCWMKESLKTMHSTGNSYCYDNISTNCDDYGRLYTWQAMMNGASASSSNPSGVQGLCPTGWHLPSEAEFQQMEVALGMAPSTAATTGYRGTDEGGKMKEPGIVYWDNPNVGATNSSGLTLRGAGYYSGSAFNLKGCCVFLWSTENDGSNTWSRRINAGTTTSGSFNYANNTGRGHSVRCLKD